MAQGKEWDKEEVIRTLEPFFKMGCNVKKACDYAGIPYTTVHTWVSNDELLRMKVTAWQNEPNRLARAAWIAKMASADGYDAGKEWMKRKEKDEFSDRVEHTGSDGAPLLIRFDSAFDEDTSQQTERTGTE